jgi:hypothetical protein
VVESAGDAAVVEVEQVGGPAEGAGVAVGVQGLQVVGGGGHAGDRGHVGVVPGGVLGDLGQQRQCAQVVVVDDRLVWAGEAQGGAGLVPGPVGAVGGGDAGADA